MSPTPSTDGRVPGSGHRPTRSSPVWAPLPFLAGPRGGTRPADILEKPVPHRAPEPPPQTPGGLTLPGESAEKVAGSTEQCLGFGTQGDARGQREAGWAGQLGQHRRAACETQLRRELWREHVGPREGRSRHGHSARPGLCPSSLWSTDPEHPEHRTVATQGPGATGVGQARRGRGLWGPSCCPARAGAGEPPGPSALCPMTPLLLLLGPHGSSELTDAGAPRIPSRSLSRGDWPLPPGPSGGAPSLLSDVLSVPAPPCPRCLSPCQLCSPSPPSSPTSHLSLPCSQKHPRDVTLS